MTKIDKLRYQKTATLIGIQLTGLAQPYSKTVPEFLKSYDVVSQNMFGMAWMSFFSFFFALIRQFYLIWNCRISKIHMNRFPHVLKKSPLTYIRGRTVLLYNVPNLNIIHAIVNLPDRTGHMLLLVLELKRNNQDHRFEGFMGFDSSVFVTINTESFISCCIIKLQNITF